MCEADVSMFQCIGHTEIPETLQDFLDISVEDDWNTNLLCVISGYKKVALTANAWDVVLDYDSLERPDEVEDYYELLGGLTKHLEILEQIDQEKVFQAKACGVDVLIQGDGTHIWFKPENRRNAELLVDTFTEDGDIKRSLLLGYTATSIILYKLINYNDQRNILTDENYKSMVDKYFKKYTPKIEKARKKLLQLGANV